MEKINLNTADWCKGMSQSLRIATLFRALNEAYGENSDLRSLLIEAGHACEYCGSTVTESHKGYCPDSS